MLARKKAGTAIAAAIPSSDRPIITIVSTPTNFQNARCASSASSNWTPCGLER